MRQLTIAVTLLLVTATTASLAADRDSDERKMRGLWEIVMWEEGGKKIDKYVGMQYIFIDGDLITINNSGRNVYVSKTSVSLDQRRTPKRIVTKNFLGKSHTSIYKLDGDTLTWAYPHSVLGEKRPAPIPSSFTTKPGDKHTLMTLKRVKDKRVERD